MFALIICGLLASFVPATSTEPTAKKGSSRCTKKKHDIFIVLDASKNVGVQEFHVLKKFLKQFISQLDVGLDKTHVGILLASPKGQAKVEINLGQHGSSKALASAIGRIKRNGKRRPDMAHALKLVQNKVFTDKEGDRPGVRNVLIVFTRRPEPANLEDLLKRSDALKSKKVEIITVALQRKELLWNVKDELTAIASMPQNVFSLQAHHLKKLKRRLNRVICHWKRATHPGKGCIRQTHDVFFVLDGSGSISLQYFQEMKNFLIKLIQKLDISRRGTHVGLLQFSDKLKTRMEFMLGEYQTFEEVRSAIERMRYQMGGTETGDALTIVNKKVFPRAGAYRANVSDIVVIITDGEARDRKLALAQAAKLRSKGIKVMAIGMGEENTVATFRQDLQLMASKPRDVFTVDFTKLHYLVKALTSEICYARPPKATKCAHQKRDILLIVDGSSSVGNYNMKKVKRFLRKLVLELNVGKRRNHIGLVQFSEVSKTRQEFDLDQYYDPKKIRREISRMRYQAGLRTMTGHALQVANEKIFTGFYGDRSHISDVIILVADGGAHDRLRALENAAKLRSRGVHMVTVFIPNSRDPRAGKKLLQQIASTPSDFYTSNFDELRHIAASLVRVVCSEDQDINTIL